MAESLKSTRASNPPPPDDGLTKRVGSVIRGKWHLDAMLGVGGMAAVYSATHRNGQRAALKILHSQLAQEETICERFRREAYVSNAIKHSACVAVLDDDMTEENEPFLVMELLEGETLRDLWKRTGRRMPVEQVLQINERVLDCLGACHRAGVIHRDLKPPNIFITNTGVVKVLDFGVAQVRSAAGEFTATGTALGTPYYMSPEQAMGLVDQLDGRADIFSVGAIIHALATGKRIHKGRTENEALILAATTPVPSVARIAPDLPLDVIKIIDKALAWDRRNRFSSAEDMLADVQEALVKLGVTPGVSVRQTDFVAAARVVSPVFADHAPEEVSKSVERSSAPKAEDPEEIAAEDDHRIVELRDLMKRVDKVLPTIRQFSWDHPATERALQTAFEGFAAALAANANAVTFTIRPYEFMRLGQTVWEPAAPFDSIPYNLFACGMRTLRMTAGLTLDEFKKLLQLLLVDPGRDLPTEDDIAAAFWEAGMPHVHYDIVDAFAEGDAAEREGFYGEADALEKAAADGQDGRSDRVEARAMNVSTDKNALLGAKDRSPMALDEVVKKLLANQLVLTSEQWSERFVDTTIEGYLDATKCNDPQLILGTLRATASDLAVAGNLSILVELHRILTAKLADRAPKDLPNLTARITEAIFRGEPLLLSLKRLKEDPSLIAGFQSMFDAISGEELDTVLSEMKDVPPGALRDAMMNYIGRVLEGHEDVVARAVTGFDFDGACTVINMLHRVRSQAARAVLTAIASGTDTALSLEAKIIMAESPDKALAEVGALLSNPNAVIRVAALRSIARHGLKTAATNIARSVKLSGFQNLSVDERREMLKTLIVLAGDRGEAVALEIAKKAGMFTNEDREQSRVAAVDALGAVSSSPSVASELRTIALARWATSDETRTAAQRAAGAVEARMTAAPQQKVPS